MQGSMEKELLAVPQPVVAPVQPPLAEAETSFLTREEIKLLDHLRGLQEMGVDLAESMTAQLEKLQLKESQTTAAKALSHGHLNRFHKLRTQVTTAGKIQDVDAGWEKFVQSIIMEKMQSHAVMYQKHRSDRLDAYNILQCSNGRATVDQEAGWSGIAKSLGPTYSDRRSAGDAGGRPVEASSGAGCPGKPSWWNGRLDGRGGGRAHRCGISTRKQGQKRISDAQISSSSSIAVKGCQPTRQTESREKRQRRKIRCIHWDHMDRGTNEYADQIFHDVRTLLQFVRSWKNFSNRLQGQTPTWEKVGRNDCQHVREHEVHKRAHCAHSDQDALHAGLKLEPLAFRDGSFGTADERHQPGQGQTRCINFPEKSLRNQVKMVKHVTSSNVVDVHCHHEGNQVSFSILEGDKDLLLRCFWHLHGQVTHWQE